ncbi:MAG: serine/threonine-protein phosphatase [Clostridiales bacterium]|nr:serine/threonine-protein phosphatase [Clostridiales bacterium]
MEKRPWAPDGSAFLRQRRFFALGFSLCLLVVAVIFSLNLHFFEAERTTPATLYNLGIDLMGSAVAALLFYGSVGRNQEDKSALNFGPVILINSVSFLLNALEWIASGVPEYRFFHLLVCVLDDGCDIILIYFFWQYIREVIGTRDRQGERLNRLVGFLVIPTELLIFANLFVPILFSVNAEGVFEQGRLYWLADVYLLFVAAVEFPRILISKAPLRQKVVVSIFIAAPCLHYLMTIGMHGYATREGVILLSILLIYEVLFEERSESLSAARKEMENAAELQQAMLPGGKKTGEMDGRCMLAASMEPARVVGGDFYDYFPVDENHLALVIADVSDKGLPAGLFMMSVKNLLHSRARQGGTPAEILSDVNADLTENNVTGMFVTVWMGILDLSTGEMVCANAGHEYPMLRSGNGGFCLFRDQHGFVLGGMAGMKYRDYTLHLSPGDAVFVYTDGLTEANNPAGEQFGLARLEAALSAAAGRAPKEILASAREYEQAFVNGAEQFDDLTMLCLEYRGSV